MNATPDSRLLGPEAVAKFSNMALVARLAVEGIVTGYHRSPHKGFSIEFAEHREYVAGDDLRFLDWVLYARTDNFYIVQFEGDTNCKVYVLLDASSSMNFGSGPVSKLHYGKCVAAALSYLAFKQGDAIGLVTFDEGIRTFLPPKGVASHLAAIFDSLQNLEPSAKTDAPKVFHDFAETMRRRSLVIVISDLLGDPEQVIKGLLHFRYDRHEIVVFHVLDHAELTFPFSGFTSFEGLEGEERLNVDPRSVREEYLKELEGFIGVYRRACHAHGIDYVQIDTAMPFDRALSSYLSKRARFG